ncbi:trypsin-like peptidase domain-containing protein [Cereibacter sphaeroides]|uniref:trypsin-like peptidase domain-containing protein n=1 Tax=Cereibacter sphaeroides TaxID=1063 RepID=UPI00313AB44A
MMKQAIFLLWLGAALPAAAPVWAQEQSETRVWVQIEARPTEAEADERARAYAEVFPDVAGYRLSSGWYAIVLGPYGTDVARLRLQDLLAAGMIPRDSFIADGRAFREPFLAPGELPPAPDAEALAVPGPEMLPEDEPLDAPPALEVAPAPLPDETPAEARRSEALLIASERQELQAALQWFGFYGAAIDGAFGPGTRASMAAWQAAEGAEATGILTARQRAELLDRYGRAQAELGLQTVTEEEAGIRITLPTALVAFDRYDPPFVHYAPKDGSGVQVMLISEPGDRGALYGLYDILQTLEVVPPEGTRSRTETGFTIEGRSADLASYTHVELAGGLLKGYMLVWHPGDDERMARVLTAMQSSFRPFGDRALDPGMVEMTEEQRRGMLAGLEVRKPRQSRSGIFVDPKGAVLTTAEAVAGCGRVTIDREHEAKVVATDAALGMALLRPVHPMAPRVTASFRSTEARLGSPVAVAGYPYGEALPAPTLTFGALDALTGLEGEADLRRLRLASRPGDAGGPVLDGSGAVLGMLVAPETGERRLPDEVSFALAPAALTARLSEAGIEPRRAEGSGALAPEDLVRLGDGMTALVSCWD